MFEITVLMPVFNGEKYIAETIDSVLSQSCDRFRYLIVDDGSKDNTEEIIRQYKDKRIDYHKLGKNMGIVHALNFGIEKISSKYIARIDADDIMCYDRLKKQYDFLDSHEEYGVVGSLIKFIDTETILEYPVSDYECKKQLWSQPCFAHPAVMYRTDIVKESRYSNSFPHAEDYFLWTQLKEKCKFSNLNEVLTCYRRHDNQVSSIYSTKQLQSHKEIVEIQLKSICNKLTQKNADFIRTALLEGKIVQRKNSIATLKELIIKLNLEKEDKLALIEHVISAFYTPAIYKDRIKPLLRILRKRFGI